MERQQYCVYNQTSECFLSLGVTLDDHLFERFKEMLAKGFRKVDEGSWTVRPKRFHNTVFFSRDLIYLDESHTVVHVIEAFRPFRIAPSRYDTASVLALPVNTIYSSQTQQGNQLVICAAEEMEFRLRSMPSLQKDEVRVPERSKESGDVPMSWLLRDSMDERRGSRRRRWPKLIAYNSAFSGLAVHGVKDVSANGLYLVTNERWPMGSEVIMTLQRTDGLDDDSKGPINVKLRVVRWGKDGVALSFIQSELEESRLMALSVI